MLNIKSFPSCPVSSCPLPSPPLLSAIPFFSVSCSLYHYFFRMIQVARQEGLIVEQNAAEILVEQVPNKTV